MKHKTVESENQPKRDGGLYPYYPLHLALKVSDAVKELGGARSEIPKSALAKHLGEGEKAATFQQRIASAKTFGLIEGRGEYLLSEAAKRFYFPTSESDKSGALLDIFSSPLAFKELLQRFDGDKLPSREILGNILHRELGVPESWKERVAAFFAQSAQTVGALDAQGFLRHKAAFHSSPVTEPRHEEIVPKAQVRSDIKFYGGGSATDGTVDVWVFSHDGKTVRLETPTGLEKILWEKLNAYVQILKPMGLDMK